MEKMGEEYQAAHKAIQALLNKDRPDHVLMDFALVTFSVSTDMDTLKDKPKYEIYSSSQYPHINSGLFAYGCSYFDAAELLDEDED